ncbi:MAG: helix-turn-helix domain-containing protein [Firmicutes bacterium]|nr:helix-turn-helix domain-containing protein [Bacillota bacterium]
MPRYLRSDFTKRQHMVSRDFEIFYYSDLHFETVPVHSHTYYEFYFFLEGDVKLEINKDSIPLREGDIIMVPPSTPHHTVILDSNVPYRRIVFWVSRTFFDQLMSESPAYAWLPEMVRQHSRHVFHPDRTAFQSLQSMLFSAIDESEGNRFGRETMLQAMIRQLVLAISRTVYETETQLKETEASSLFQRLVGYVESHLDEEISLDDLAGAFYLSKYYLSHLFKEISGLSVHQYITRRRLEACRTRIIAGEDITQTSQMYGFSDYSSFYRAFTKEYGMSPKKYREMAGVTAHSRQTQV